MKKKIIHTIFFIFAGAILATGCQMKSATKTEGNASEESSTVETVTANLLPEERSSITMGKLSQDHEFYNEVISMDPSCADYINELTIYDAEIDDTFVVHISLPPDYEANRAYPMIVMTDGVWRLSDHPELRPLMVSGQIEDIIMVSIGYPNGYDYNTIRKRDLVNSPDNFLHFIVDNLVPYLEEIYSVDPENMTLTGHSLGGYFAYYALFHSDTIGNNTFKNYYIGSPSMWASTSGTFMSTYEEDFYSRSQTLNANVYVTVGSNEDSGFIGAVESFYRNLDERNYEGLNLTYEKIEGYDHNTVFKPSIKNTLMKFYGKDPDSSNEQASQWEHNSVGTGFH